MFDFNIGDTVKFYSKVWTEAYYLPYYDAYKGHTFKIFDIDGEHIGLRCVDDQTVKVAGYVHDDEIYKV